MLAVSEAERPNSNETVALSVAETVSEADLSANKEGVVESDTAMLSLTGRT